LYFGQFSDLGHANKILMKGLSTLKTDFSLTS
jgi:hypothetical protein